MLKNQLTDNGLVMYNRMSQNDIALKNTETFYDQCFKAVFLKSEMLQLNGNRMLLGNYSSKN
jgi:hypothetical protein